MTDLCTVIFRSRCTLKEDRQGGEHKQEIIIHYSPRRSGLYWREQTGYELFGHCLMAAMERHIEGKHVRVIRVAGEYKTGGKTRVR